MRLAFDSGIDHSYLGGIEREVENQGLPRCLKHHLVRRGNVWYFRRRVGRHLVEAFGSPVIQFWVTNLAKASRLREAQDIEWTRERRRAPTPLGQSA
jgi:hypothetical protein